MYDQPSQRRLTATDKVRRLVAATMRLIFFEIYTGSFECNNRDTILQIRFPLWSTVRLNVIIISQPPSRGLPLFATRERSEQLCVFESRKLSPLSSFLL